MSSTSDLAPGRRKSPAQAAADLVDDAADTARERQLESQIAQLQSDLKSIASTLAKIGGDKVEEAKGVAKAEINHLQAQGQRVVEDVQDKAGDVEQQLKDTIREKPLTSVATAVGIGFILALLTRG